MRQIIAEFGFVALLVFAFAAIAKEIVREFVRDALEDIREEKRRVAHSRTVGHSQKRKIFTPPNSLAQYQRHVKQ